MTSAMPEYGDQKAALSNGPDIKLETSASLEAFGGGAAVQAVGDAEAGITSIHAEIAARQAYQANHTAVVGAIGKLAKKQSDLLYAPPADQDGIPNPDKGAIYYEGKDALGASHDVMDKFNQAATDISGELSNDEQRYLFQQHVVSSGDELYQQLQHHAGQQIQRLQDTTLKGTLETLKSKTIQNWGNEAISERAIRTQVAVLKDYFNMKGMPTSGDNSQAYQSELLKLTTENRAGIIDQMLANKQDLAANQYFEDHKTEIDGPTQDKLTKALDEGNQRGQVERGVKGIIAITNNEATAVENAFKWSDDPKIRSQVVDGVKRYYQEQAGVAKSGLNETYSQIVGTIPTNYTGSARDFFAPSQWTALSPEQQKAAEAHTLPAPPVSHDTHKVWGQFMDVAKKTPEDLGKLSRIDFDTKYWSALDEPHREEALTLWQEAARAHLESPKLAEATATHDAVTDMTKTFGSPDDAKLYQQLETELNQRVEEFKGLTQKAPNPEEIQKMKDAISLKFYGGKNQVLPMARDDQGRFYVGKESIPAKDWAYMQAKAGGSVKDEALERAYAAYQENDKKTYNSILSGQK